MHACEFNVGVIRYNFGRYILFSNDILKVLRLTENIQIFHINFH